MLKSKTAEFNLKPLPKKQRKEVDTPCGRTAITIANAKTIGITVVIFADRTTKGYKTKALRPPLIGSKQRRQMRQNYIHSQANDDYNPKPVVKLFNPYGNQTWLLSELDPRSPNIAYGLADLGMQCVEWGAIDLNEIKSIYMSAGLDKGRICMSINCQGKGVPAVEQDVYFKPRQGIWDYMREYTAMDYPRITA